MYVNVRSGSLVYMQNVKLEQLLKKGIRILAHFPNPKHPPP